MLARLINILKGCTGEITWEFLNQETKKIKGTKQNKTKPPALNRPGFFGGHFV